MYPQYNCLNVPTWIIGPALGEGLLIDRPADVLKVWPTREPIQRLPPAQFSPLLDQLLRRRHETEFYARQASILLGNNAWPLLACSSRALPFPSWGSPRKTSLSNLRGKENVGFLRSGSLTPALSGQRRET